MEISVHTLYFIYTDTIIFIALKHILSVPVRAHAAYSTLGGDRHEQDKCGVSGSGDLKGFVVMMAIICTDS